MLSATSQLEWQALCPPGYHTKMLTWEQHDMAATWLSPVANMVAGLGGWSSHGRPILLLHISGIFFWQPTTILWQADAWIWWGALSGQHHYNDNNTKEFKNVATKQWLFELQVACAAYSLPQIQIAQRSDILLKYTGKRRSVRTAVYKCPEKAGRT